MTPRQIANATAREVGQQIGVVVADDMAWHREHPQIAYWFHLALAVTLPKWRWLAIRWHRMRARRAFAMALARGKAGHCLRTPPNALARHVPSLRAT